MMYNYIKNTRTQEPNGITKENFCNEIHIFF